VKSERIVTLTRLFRAPRERVFAAWTRAEHLAHWFGPRGFTVPSCEADPRPGGALRVCMRSPRGEEFWVRGVFREFVPPERVLIWCVADDEAGDLALEETIDARFAEEASGTVLSLRASASGSSARARAMLEGMEPGWHQTIDRLGSHVDRS
jgi:uncharacterized protein YndB with AHSA1/START domain